MRDVNRIDVVLSEIKEIWTQYPDLRLGQLLLNVMNNPALYYCEDKQLVDRLKSFYGGRTDE